MKKYEEQQTIFPSLNFSVSLTKEDADIYVNNKTGRNPSKKITAEISKATTAANLSLAFYLPQAADSHHLCLQAGLVSSPSLSQQQRRCAHLSRPAPSASSPTLPRCPRRGQARDVLASHLAPLPPTPSLDITSACPGSLDQRNEPMNGHTTAALDSCEARGGALGRHGRAPPESNGQRGNQGHRDQAP